MIRAMDRGRQLTRSMGLAMDSADHATLPPSEQNVQDPISSKAPAEPSRIEQNPLPFKIPFAPPRDEQAPAPIQARPLETLQAFQDSLREAKDLNSLLGTFVQSLHQDAGFDRVGLALLNPSDSDLLVGRLVLGATPLAPHLRALSGSLGREHQFFLNVLKRLDPLLVPDFTNQTAGTMKLEFVDTWNPASGILASLRVGTRPIGLIYCDRGTRNRPVLPRDYQSFLLFFTQTTLGMNHLAGVM
ncbi:MAG: GAF domain-containing protein [Nitrospira sp.]|nr:MAG: GAF domain-containing protein [Nitrospira sp.]